MQFAKLTHKTAIAYQSTRVIYHIQVHCSCQTIQIWIFDFFLIHNNYSTTNIWNPQYSLRKHSSAYAHTTEKFILEIIIYSNVIFSNSPLHFPSHLRTSITMRPMSLSPNITYMPCKHLPVKSRIRSSQKHKSVESDRQCSCNMFILTVTIYYFMKGIDNSTLVLWLTEVVHQIPECQGPALSLSVPLSIIWSYHPTSNPSHLKNLW